jgi:hypothetical protein
MRMKRTMSEPSGMSVPAPCPDPAGSEQVAGGDQVDARIVLGFDRELGGEAVACEEVRAGGRRATRHTTGGGTGGVWNVSSGPRVRARGVRPPRPGTAWGSREVHRRPCVAFGGMSPIGPYR